MKSTKVILPDDSNMILLPVYASDNRRIDPRMLSTMNPYQKKEIIDGINKGLDISLYAKPEFDANQMNIIKDGLKKGLDVSLYARPEFNASQMHVIRDGLDNGVDVSVYAHPHFDYEQMDSIRSGLQAGVDVSVYARPEFDAGQMFQIMLAMLHNKDLQAMANGSMTDMVIDISKLANPDNSEDMMETIYAIRGHNNFDIDFIIDNWGNHEFLNDDFMGGLSHHQKLYVVKGLERGFDPSIYADVKFSTKQTQKIYLGMLDGLDVSVYAKPEFSPFQMEEIRKGLQAGIDVSSYADSNIEPSIMDEIRTNLIREKNNRQ
jgi:hypothetical protein